MLRLLLSSICHGIAVTQRVIVDAMAAAPAKRPRLKRNETGDSSQDWVESVNAEHLVKVQEALAACKGNATISPVFTANPLKASEGGCQGAPFLKQMYQASLSRNNSYKCNGNLLWGNWLDSSTPGVPIREAQLQAIRADFGRPPPLAFPWEVTFIIEDDEYDLSLIHI